MTEETSVWTEEDEKKLTNRIWRAIPVVIAGYFLLLFLTVGALYAYWNRYMTVPEQPINFSHKIHVFDNGLPCSTCHKLFEKSSTAGIPAIETCMSCHKSVAAGKPEIKKVRAFWDRKEPIPWERVHNLPDHVLFSHKPHIKAGLDCAACHGEIKAMPVVKQVRSLEMGFCVQCHRKKNAPLECATCHK
ncbi:MAG: hypothetical protein D6679_06085 [Candidatus Hydrogenedentota bacterium]|nr:MAG: hypothetical protein D6679_06085 [Candidatus Hydrogenedentota bacterium]